MIPQLISQTWRSPSLPDGIQALCDGWKRLNAEFEYRFFTDDDCAKVVEDVSPEHLKAYLSFRHPVMRADYFRYAVIYRDGGLYADIDMECLRPVGPLLKTDGALLTVEALVTRARQAELGYARPYQVANCIFAAVPRHPLFRDAMDRCIELNRKYGTVRQSEIEDVTGPRMLTRLHFEDSHRDIRVLRQIHLMAPLHYPSLWPVNVNMHARHRCRGSWKTELEKSSLARRWQERNRWPNPFAAGTVDWGDTYALTSPVPQTNG